MSLPQMPCQIKHRSQLHHAALPHTARTQVDTYQQRRMQVSNKAKRRPGKTITRLTDPGLAPEWTFVSTWTVINRNIQLQGLAETLSLDCILFYPTLCTCTYYVVCTYVHGTVPMQVQNTMYLPMYLPM